MSSGSPVKFVPTSPELRSIGIPLMPIEMSSPLLLLTPLPCNHYPFTPTPPTLAPSHPPHSLPSGLLTFLKSLCPCINLATGRGRAFLSIEFSRSFPNVPLILAQGWFLWDAFPESSLKFGLLVTVLHGIFLGLQSIVFDYVSLPSHIPLDFFFLFCNNWWFSVMTGFSFSLCKKHWEGKRRRACPNPAHCRGHVSNEDLTNEWA